MHRAGDGPARERRADQLSELLSRGRGADEIARLQILRDVAGLRRRDRDDGADRQHRRARRRIGPAGRREHRRDAEQRDERDAGRRLRRHADDADDARGDGDEEQAEHPDAGRADRALQRTHVAGEHARHDRGHGHHQHDGADDEAARQIAIGVRRPRRTVPDRSDRGFRAPRRRTRRSWSAGRARR